MFGIADYAAFQRRWKRDRDTLVHAKRGAPSSRLAAAGRVLCEADAKDVLAWRPADKSDPTGKKLDYDKKVVLGDLDTSTR